LPLFCDFSDFRSWPKNGDRSPSRPTARGHCHALSHWPKEADACELGYSLSHTNGAYLGVMFGSIRNHSHCQRERARSHRHLVTRPRAIPGRCISNSMLTFLYFRAFFSSTRCCVPSSRLWVSPLSTEVLLVLSEPGMGSQMPRFTVIRRWRADCRPSPLLVEDNGEYAEALTLVGLCSGHGRAFGP
jgi:hypothetical protein